MPRRQPLKEFGFRLLVPVVTMVIAVLVAFIVVPLAAGRHERGPLWAYLLGAAVVIIIGGAAVVLGLFIGQRLVGDRIEAAMREPGQKWRHGRFLVTPGSVVFERYRWQLRIPSGHKTDLTHVQLGADTGRRPPLRQLWTINPQLHIITLNSDQGSYDIAAAPSRIELLQEQLNGHAGR